ncbi:hypothetical protein KXW40_005949 [Aspergillus fumigatus]|nr:hypothetical protein KXX49_002431 [Aspergillus fumigatus]KAH1954881.1 hypothetical protein KXV59_002930 [Aspergillus fumigatus]KAH1976127.1 hypothetical protein KXX04_002574 [Aspergillus fumigatus]KAH2064079.1 hypothetical protein KXW21_007458 [Aspergillus fumigatus]KAH2411487.1 hypothetical protein KXV53_005167 [Aspergillus fumigatus]
MGSLWNYLGLGSTANDEKNAIRALPSSWYTSQEMYELERRAIFSRKWLLTTHKLRLPNPGDWLRYEVSGFQFVLVKDRDGNINAFHNVCRHRAFPVVTEEKGTSRIFACKYHGWSYGLNGKLAKAPGYQELDGFDKSKNGLLPIHVHIDANGFIWVNLDAGEKPEVAWEDDFKGMDRLPRYEHVKWDDFAFDHTWEQEGEYNWKILADNYNECYHCPTTHPDIPSIADLSAYSVEVRDGGIIHDGRSKPEQVAAGLNPASTFFFPNASLTVSPHFFFMQRFVPLSPTRSIMKYEVYRNTKSSDEDFEKINQIYKRIMSEDKYLCDLTQKNLNAGVFVNGELHPEMEKGPLYFQKTVRDLVVEHYEREQKAKQEIWPARQNLPKTATKDRLAELEEKVNLLLKGNIPTRGRESVLEDAKDLAETRFTQGSQPRDRRDSSYSDPSPPNLAFDDASPQPSSLAVARAVDSYMKYCHRQPVWCFNFEEHGDLESIPEELLCSIIALTARFSHEGEHGQHHADTAKSLIMLRIANGTVELSTIEALCLLAYSSFIDGDMHLGRFHLGLAFQLCRSALLDTESAYTPGDPNTERKKRLFWSLQLLEQSYGRQTGLLSIPLETWRPADYFSGNSKEPQRDAEKPPPLPRDTIGCAAPDDTGIWSMTVHFGWVWSKVRTYVSDCANNRLREPWRHESMYSMVLSDLTEIENQTPLCHRYDHVRFYDRQPDELIVNRAYWIPWLKLQFMYHAILIVLNHPFLYIMASRHNPNLAIPNSFWRRSSELVLLHATWIVRMIDMLSDKDVRLTDPFFAHVAAIAATVQLYYCCAGDPRLKYKSRADLARCRVFLRSFVPFSRACASLNRSLDRMTRIAAGTENVDYDSWVPSKIHLNIPLMWNILQFTCSDDSYPAVPSGSLLHSSLSASATRNDAEESSTLEIIVTTSPEVTVNTADGGQGVPMPLYRAPNSSKDSNTSPATAPQSMPPPDAVVAPIDSLMLNTPWLWADPAPFGDVDDLDYSTSAPAIGDIEAWHQPRMHHLNPASPARATSPSSKITAQSNPQLLPAKTTNAATGRYPKATARPY